MLLTIRRRFIITLDEDEAEEFLDDATAVQTRVREQLNGHSGGTQTAKHVSPAPAAPPRVPGKRGRPSKTAAPPKAARRTMKKIACPECGALKPAHWMARHRLHAHGMKSSDAAPSADAASVE